jgi:hypothetical protein
VLLQPFNAVHGHGQLHALPTRKMTEGAFPNFGAGAQILTTLCCLQLLPFRWQQYHAMLRDYEANSGSRAPSTAQCTAKRTCGNRISTPTTMYHFEWWFGVLKYNILQGESAAT